MKKQLLLIAAFVFTAWQVNAQVLLGDDFEGGAVPSGWTQSTLASDGGWKAGINTALQSGSWGIPAHTKMLATNDDACNCNKSNDLLKTASFSTVGQTTVAVKFDLYFNHGSYGGAQEEATLEISTNGGTVWTVLQTFTGSGSWNTVIQDISLPAYLNQASVMIGFRYNDGAGYTFGCAIDNFAAYVPYLRDASVQTVVLNPYVANTSSVPVTGVLMNLASAPIVTMDLNYQVDAGPTVTQSLSGLNIAAINGTYTYTHGTPWTAGPVGTHTIKVWASNINAGVDQDLTNDSKTNSTIVASQLVAHLPAVEEFSSSTCVPCAAFNTTFDPLLAANNTNTATGEVSCIRYQMNWPAPGDDPSYNPDGVTRQTYYAVNSIPSPWIDGKPMATSDQAELDSYAAKLCPATMSCTYSVALNKVDVQVKVTPYITVASGSKLYIGLMEKQYMFTTNPTTQHEFDHIMRKMLPNGSGTTLALADGVQQTFNQTYTFPSGAVPPAQGSYSLWTNTGNLEVIAFVQNTTTKEIYQSVIGTLTVGMNEVNTDFSVSLFPNPVKNNLVVNLNTPKASPAAVAIYNTLGQIVYTENTACSSGTNNLHIDTAKLMSGMYVAKVTVAGQTKAIKFNIEK